MLLLVRALVTERLYDSSTWSVLSLLFLELIQIASIYRTRVLRRKRKCSCSAGALAWWLISSSSRRAVGAP
jgi:hypothetical protein